MYNEITGLKPEVCDCYLVLGTNEVGEQIVLSASPDGQYRTVYCGAHADQPVDIPFEETSIIKESRLLSHTRDTIENTESVMGATFTFDDKRNLVFALPKGVSVDAVTLALKNNTNVDETKVILE